MSQKKVESVLKIPKLPGLGGKILSEAFGTFFIVLVTAMVNDLSQKSNQGALAVGCLVTVLVYSLNPFSNFFNPAVAFAFYCTGFLKKSEWAIFCATQLFGGWCGSLVAWGLIAEGVDFPVTKPVSDETAAVVKVFIAELIGTLALITVAMQCGVSKQRGNEHYGLACGFTVLGISYAIGPTSGASLNPAMTTSLMLTHAISNGTTKYLKYWPVYTIAHLLAAFLGFVIFCALGSYHEDDELVFNEEENTSNDEEEEKNNTQYKFIESDQHSIQEEEK
jgi:glycerol uptake facilitator protein